MQGGALVKHEIEKSSCGGKSHLEMNYLLCTKLLPFLPRPLPPLVRPSERPPAVIYDVTVAAAPPCFQRCVRRGVGRGLATGWRASRVAQPLHQ